MSDYWKGKRVLVTGHTGFVGAWLCCALREKGACVTGFSLKEEKGSLYEKIKKDIDIDSVYGDLRDKEEVFRCISDCDPDIVFHIAAFGFVKECYADPGRAFSSNVNGTLNLLESIKKMEKSCKIVVASSDKVYKNNGLEDYLFSENDPLGGLDPYSASKTCEDLLVQSYYDSYLCKNKCSVCIIRPSNILGGGDHNINRLIPSIYYNLKLKKKPEVRNPESVRPWQSIFDIVDAYMVVAKQIEGGCHIYNVGPNPEGIKTVGEIATYVARLFGKEYEKEVEIDSEVKENAYLGLSIDRIKDELGWSPRMSIEGTLEDIFRFYSQDNGSNTYELCVSQIREYYGEVSWDE